MRKAVSEAWLRDEISAHMAGHVLRRGYIPRIGEFEAKYAWRAKMERHAFQSGCRSGRLCRAGSAIRHRFEHVSDVGGAPLHRPSTNDEKADSFLPSNLLLSSCILLPSQLAGWRARVLVFAEKLLALDGRQQDRQALMQSSYTVSES